MTTTATMHDAPPKATGERSLKNLLVLGSGRSGTSMVTGLLARCGYFMGEKLLGANPGNPNGRFEDAAVNRINEDLLDRVVPRRPRLFGDLLFRHRPVKHQRWLAAVPLDAPIRSTPQINDRIARLTAGRTFCFKDPRFSYTLDIWRPHLGDARFLCIFRHPAATARSMVKEVDGVPLLRDNLRFDFRRGIGVWKAMYRHILERHDGRGTWLFLHYRQLLDGSAFDRLEAFTGGAVDRELVDRRLERSLPDPVDDPEADALYRRLCERAGYADE